jgi:hypothetical protein
VEKAAFLLGLFVKWEDFNGAIRPSPLVSLLQELRRFFGQIYVLLPEREPLRLLVEETRAKAFATLQDTLNIIKIFDEYLTSRRERWPDALLDHAFDYHENDLETLSP